MRLKDSLGPLGTRAFRLLWIGQAVSSAGNAMAMIGIVFAILRAHGTATDIGYVLAIQAATSVAALLAGGVWADRLPRQVVMLVADTIRAVAEAGLVILLVVGQARIWELALGAAVFGLAQSFFGPASTGLIAETAAANDLQRANGLMNSATNFASAGGLAVAGVLIAALGPAVVLAIDALTFAVSAVSLGLLELERREVPERASFRRDLAAGWDEVIVRPWYWLSLIAHSMGNFGFGAYFVLGPVVAARMLGGAPAWGVIMAADAVGAGFGSGVAARVTTRRPLVAGNIALTLAMLPLLALAVPMATWVVAVAAGIGASGLMFLATVWMSTMQSLIPADIQSRVDSYDWLISLAIMPVGMALTGPIADHIGAAWTLVGAALLIGPPCMLLLLVPEVRRVCAAPDGRITGPAPRERSGLSGLDASTSADRLVPRTEPAPSRVGP